MNQEKRLTRKDIGIIAAEMQRRKIELGNETNETYSADDAIDMLRESETEGSQFDISLAQEVIADYTKQPEKYRVGETAKPERGLVLKVIGEDMKKVVGFFGAMLFRAPFAAPTQLRKVYTWAEQDKKNSDEVASAFYGVMSLVPATILYVKAYQHLFQYDPALGKIALTAQIASNVIDLGYEYIRNVRNRAAKEKEEASE